MYNNITKSFINKDYQMINIDGSTINNNLATQYRGLGVITGNNSSRLLMDYKQDNPEQYWEIMNYLFKKDAGAGLTHIKIEMGADVNSSSGTEPCTMRSEDEQANVNRGAGFMFACDALSINPNITIDLLRWGEPKWVTDAFKVNQENGHKARYKWYLETIKSAYDTYGIKFSYVSADANETLSVDVDWIIYLSKHLKSEKNSRYDYSTIKIIASDEVGAWRIADEMMKNEELRNSVDILGEHYNTWASDNAKVLNQQYGKELWYSEGIASMNIAKLTINGGGTGINGVNGCLDVCNRIINGYYRGHMTMYEYQPAVASYYSGSRYFPKSLIIANEPWSGYFDIDAGLWTSAHFTMFMEPGWKYIDSACYGDGEENHSITKTTNNYMTTTNPKTGDYSIVICNDSNQQRNYTFKVFNLNKVSSNVNVWQTIGPKDKSQKYNGNYLQKIATYQPIKNSDNTYSYSIEVEPYSIVTITTLEKDNVPIPSQIDCSVESKVLELPYYDNFQYNDKFLQERGNTPRYTTDQGGAFEVAQLDGNNVLMQQITLNNKPTDWHFGKTANPITSLGDDRWSNYNASTDFKFDTSGTDENYVGFGVRYLSSEIDNTTAENGYILKVYQNGKWEFKKNTSTIYSGIIKNFNSSIWHNMSINANENVIISYVDNVEISSYTDKIGFANSGRISILSNYYNNIYDNLKVEPIKNASSHIVRVDTFDSSISYFGNWDRNFPRSFNEFNRTTSISQDDTCSFKFSFTGTQFALVGPTDSCTIQIDIDGVKSIYQITATISRQTFFKISTLDNHEHNVTVRVLSGKLILDVIEYS